jgi:pre-mRNA-splicing factor SYF1
VPFLIVVFVKMALQQSGDNNVVGEDNADKLDFSKIVIMEEEDIAYEENILRNPYSLRAWQTYIDHKIKTKAPTKQVRIVYERALQVFSRSYVLWYDYLRYRRRILMTKPVTDIAYSHLCDAYERCLVFMNKVWFYSYNIFILFRCLVFGLTI